MMTLIDYGNVASPTDVDIFFMGTSVSSNPRQCLPFDDLELMQGTFRSLADGNTSFQALSLVTTVLSYTYFLSSMSESVNAMCWVRS